MRLRALTFAVVVAVVSAIVMLRAAQGTNVLIIRVVAALPVSCAVGESFLLTDGSGLSVCTAADTFTPYLSGTAAAGVPTGAIIFVASGTCPTGYAEVAGLNGKMWRGTVAANANVGTTGGADSVTPTFTGNSITSSAVSAGTPAGSNNAPTLTMNSYTPAGTNGTAAFTPAGTNAAITAGTPAGTISALTTGADSSTTGGVAKAIAQTPTFTGSALATHNHTFTGSAGTVPAQTFTGSAATLTGSVAAPTFTGSALATHTHTTTATGTISAVDTRAAYILLIGCQKS